ncbi:hypothetical protein NOJ05_04490 [Neorhizobium galegae]|uniref:hypothetical protein n=1 Tax=Neorhizobium galegae TaxID=399 RepID=UPI0006220D02|nr:hypothetical protein [Neorhizobium galegae]CDZ29062.1 Hypothetical protein NGAL_HAMBI490_39240 [Neorhizobium galegae bv. officinalis]MCQ1768665.1 hypothetical protein [Neorhizobium galegae]MCQ1776447.1 hypothetical protein [Neorhizobium galegae]MCQ1798702.1 hypothetical protein [Neorhizobium galegae]MCQ1847637.1 hypothetical protein [Neorhizobium galegae]
MQKETYLFQEADKILMEAIDEAIDNAARTAGDELQRLGSRISPHDYFADGVLRHLFLRLCGADLTTSMGGDPETAWKFLYLGRSAARRWERERGSPAALRKKKDRREDIEKDKSERQQLELSAQNFVLKTVIRALVDRARASDPEITNHLEAAIDARHARLESVSDTDREFTERAKSYLSLLTGSPH